MSSVDISQSKKALDTVINKSRVHLYKPIQIAEILYHHRVKPNLGIELENLDTYRTRSRLWRDVVCRRFLNRTCTSSSRFQDNLFENNAIPPKILTLLGSANKETEGGVEAYIYNAFEVKHLQLENALQYCINNTKSSFKLQTFLSQFWDQPGLKRSLDKVFEVVVYSLFEVLTTSIDIKVDIYYDKKNIELLNEFSAFSEKVLNLSSEDTRKTLSAHFHRVGVTNAADRGLDIYANFGSVVQIKHLSLDKELAEDVVTSITSEKIIIVCKDVEESIIKSLLSQIGWRSRIQSIITIDELASWYDIALNGKYSNLIGDSIISTLSEQIKSEFPSVGNNDWDEFKNSRGYDKLNFDGWDKIEGLF